MVVNDASAGLNAITVSVDAPSIAPPMIRERPSSSATAAAPIRLSGVVPSDAHVPTDCGGSARMMRVAVITSTASATPSASRFFQPLFTTPPVRWQDIDLVSSACDDGLRDLTLVLIRC